METQTAAQSSPPGLPAADAAGSRGSLAGKTILRFAHAFESGGGTERYLDDLDRVLLERNAMTIVRVQLTRGGAQTPPAEAAVGRGRLVVVGLPTIAADKPNSSGDDHSIRFRLKQKARDWVLYNPLVWRAAGAKWTAGLRLPRRPGEAVGAGNATAAMMGPRRVDLAMLHFFGGADADEVIAQARAHRVPFAVLNHYSNDRFLHLAIRKHAMAADGVAGVNGLQVPGYLRRRFAKLSDGIDTEFFHPAQARPVPSLPAEPVVLLPARVVREKGQLDLVRAAAALRDAGVKCQIRFAGRVDTAEFLAELQGEIARAGLTESARVLGEMSLPDLRDWYAASAVIAFPTYHHEGLPRVIIEAQAAGTPVVAYATGGIPDAIVPGSTGLLVPTGDVAGLARRLGELLGSATLRSAMAARARQVAEQQFSLRALAERHEAYYLQVIADASRGGRPASS